MDDSIRSFALYGEEGGLPGPVHCETLQLRSARHDWRIAPHRHPRLHQLFLVTRGEVEMTLDGALRARAAPVLINLPAMSVHGFRFAPGSAGHVLTLMPEALPEAFGPEAALAPRLLRAGMAVPGPEPGLEETMQRLQDWQRREGFARGPMLRALALQAAAMAAMAMEQAEPLAQPGPDRMHRRFEALIATHLRQGWRVADYAAALAVTPAHLTRMTRAATGLTASRLIEERVMAEATRELAYTRRPVAQVAFDLGFQDPPYFARAFRRVMGCSPSAFRRRAAP